jgi:hypothetical protein
VDPFFAGAGILFLLIPLFIGLVFVVVLGAFAVAFIRAMTRWSRNNAAPLETVPAVVVTKRGQVIGGSGDSSASTSYFATFEIRGGERLEFGLSGQDYGQLVENDRGRLTHQGTRYKGFTRTPQDR